MSGYKRYDKHQPAERMEFALECHQFNPAWKSIVWSDGTKHFWLPKSATLIRDNRGGVQVPKTGVTYTISIPVWLAQKEGLI